MRGIRVYVRSALWGAVAVVALLTDLPKPAFAATQSRHITSHKHVRPLPGVLDVTKLKAIVMGAAPTRLEQTAAKELRAYLKKMYGIEIPIESQEKISAASVDLILLGKAAALASGAVRREELEAVAWDGYVIKASAKLNAIVIAGPRGRATLFGVIGFLEQVGCRFYGPVETVPTPADKHIPAFSLSDRPAFEFRRCQGKPGWKLRTSYDDVGDPTKGPDADLFKGSNLWIDHTAGYLVPIKLYYDKHPEYYALIGGKRVPSGRGKRSDRDATLCLSNPDVIRISAERLNAWVESQPERRHFAITYGDTGKWCQCPNCKKINVGHGHADLDLYWVNAVAREVGKKHPDKLFWTFAYQSTQPVPQQQKPEPNVIVLYTPWYGLSTICRKHPYSICWRAVHGAMEMEDWLKWSPHNLGVYDYSLGNDPQLYSYAYRIRFWAKRGYRGFFECGDSKAFRALQDYVKARLLWDPSLDPDELIDTFCEAYYGPAGRHVAACLRTFYLEKVENGTHKNRGDPAYPSHMLAHIEAVEKAAPGTPFEKRAVADLDTFMKSAHGYGLSERKEKLTAAVGKWGAEGGLLPEIEPAAGFQGYAKDKLWLSKPRIARKGAKDDAQLTQLSAICSGDAAADVQAAKKLQNLIQTIYGLQLPVESREINHDTKGVLLVGRKAALASGLVTEEDFKAAGPVGAVVRGLDGRVVLAASRDENVTAALDLFVYVMRMRHGGVRALGRKLPTSRAPIIREFTLIDWPPFGPDSKLTQNGSTP